MPAFRYGLTSSPDRTDEAAGLIKKTRKLLFVTDVFPHPLDRGDRIRILNLLQACGRDYEVTLLVATPETSSSDDVPRCVSQVIFVDLGQAGAFKWRHYLQAIRCSIGLPFPSMVRYRAKFLRAMEGLDLSAFDLIWAERPHLGCLFHAQRKRTIIDLDDVEHLRLRLLIPLQRSLLIKLHSIYRYLIYRHAELRQFRGFLRLLVCSKEDRDYLVRKRAGSASIVPNGAVIAPALETRRIRSAGQPLRLVFLGNMGHPPNDDAVRFFADQVLPAARSVIETFDVIGPNVSDELRQEFSDRVNFRGYIENLPVALSEYDVMVAPIRFGSGTKLKLLEAMAHKLVFVATPCAAAGLDLADETHALLASTPQEMARCLARLAQSPQLGEQLATNAYLHACERFSWDSIQDSLAVELKRL